MTKLEHVAMLAAPCQACQEQNPNPSAIESELPRKQRQASEILAILVETTAPWQTALASSNSIGAGFKQYTLREHADTQLKVVVLFWPQAQSNFGK